MWGQSSREEGLLCHLLETVWGQSSREEVHYATSWSLTVWGPEHQTGRPTVPLCHLLETNCLGQSSGEKGLLCHLLPWWPYRYGALLGS